MGNFRRLIARILHGSELAVDPRWRAYRRAEIKAQHDHGRVREIRLARKELIHSALRNAVQGRGN